MKNYQNEMIKFARLFTAAYTVIALCGVAANEYFDAADTLPEYAAAVCQTLLAAVLLAVCFLLYRRTFGKPDKTTMWKLLPFVFTPYALLHFARQVLQHLAGFLPEMSPILSAVISGVITLAVGIAGFLLLPKLCIWYAAVLTEKGGILFPAPYGLRNKWWFYLAAALGLSLFSAALTVLPFGGSGMDFFLSPTWAAITELLSDGLWAGLLLGFFRLAFKNIDRDTQKLFYLHITGICGASGLTGRLTSALLSGATRDLYAMIQGDNVRFVPALLLALAAAAATLACGILCLYGLYRSLKIYEAPQETVFHP